MQNSYDLTGDFNDDMSAIVIDHNDVWARTLHQWKDKALHLRVSLMDADRSGQQNRYFHGVIVQIIKDWLIEVSGKDYDTDQTKQFIYREVLGYELKEYDIAGVTYYRLEGKTIRDWGMREFNKKKLAIQEWGARFDLDIPDPDPLYYTKLKSK